MKNLMSILIGSALILSSFNVAKAAPVVTENGITINETGFFRIIGNGSTITWNDANSSGFVYSLKLVKITTNGHSEIWDALHNDVGIVASNLSGRSFTINEELEAGSNYIILIVKHPTDMGFSDYVESLENSELPDCMATWYYRTEGDTPPVAPCGTAPNCGTDCTDGSCSGANQNGEDTNCGCSGTFCFSTLCSMKITLTPMAFE